jgi:hypothetical protein
MYPIYHKSAADICKTPPTDYQSIMRAGLCIWSLISGHI